MFETNESSRVAIALRRRLDVDLFGQLLSHTPFCHVVMATTDIKRAMSLIRSRGAKAFILDANYPKDLLEQAVHGMHGSADGQSLLFIDDYYSPHHAHFASSVQAAYCSRDISSYETLDILERLVNGCSEPPSTTNGLIQSERRIRVDHPIVAGLSDREMEVMLLLAEGNSVKQCAELMQLAESTIENHKFRLMRKLGVHRFMDVLRLAIRSGLISA